MGPVNPNFIYNHEQAHEPIKAPESAPKIIPVKAREALESEQGLSSDHLLKTKDIDLSEDEELNAQITRLFKGRDSVIIEIPLDSPFHGTDLIVFKDDYKGELPLNGIREDDLDVLTFMLDELIKTNNFCALNITSHTGESGEVFKKQIIDALKILSTREIGRTLLSKLWEGRSDIHIEYTSNPCTPGICKFQEGKPIIVAICPEVTVFERVNKAGTRCLEECPLFITLAHEFVHALHAQMDDANVKAPGEKGIGNLEEFRTIKGWQDAYFQESVMLKHDETKPGFFEDWDRFPQTDTNDIEYWDPLSENGFRSVFQLPPRIDHETALIHWHRMDQLQNLQPEEAMALFILALRAGDIEEVDKLLEHGFEEVIQKKQDVQKFYETYLPMTLEYGQLGSLKKLLELSKTNPQDNYLELAVNGHNPTPELLDYLVKECGLDPKSESKVLGTLLYQAIQHHNLNCLQKLVELGADPHKFDPNGIHVLHYLARRGDASPKLFEFLVKEVGIDPEIQTTDGTKRTPLGVASKENKPILEKLIAEKKP